MEKLYIIGEKESNGTLHHRANAIRLCRLLKGFWKPLRSYRVILTHSNGRNKILSHCQNCTIFILPVQFKKDFFMTGILTG